MADPADLTSEAAEGLRRLDALTDHPHDDFAVHEALQRLLISWCRSHLRPILEAVAAPTEALPDQGARVSVDNGEVWAEVAGPGVRLSVAQDEFGYAAHYLTAADARMLGTMLLAFVGAAPTEDGCTPAVDRTVPYIAPTEDATAARLAEAERQRDEAKALLQPAADQLAADEFCPASFIIAARIRAFLARGEA